MTTALKIEIELQERRSQRRILIDSIIWADERDTDNELITTATRHQTEQGGEYQLLDYRIEPAQLEMF